MGDGILKFLDYIIELKEKNPDMFYDLLTDYELSSLCHNILNLKNITTQTQENTV